MNTLQNDDMAFSQYQMPRIALVGMYAVAYSN